MTQGSGPWVIAGTAKRERVYAHLSWDLAGRLQLTLVVDEDSATIHADRDRADDALSKVQRRSPDLGARLCKTVGAPRHDERE